MKLKLVLAILVTPLLAQAQTYSEPQQSAAPGASDVNTLNGQPIKVGERNQYLRSYKRFNVALNPFSALDEKYSLSLSAALTSQVALRGDITLAQAHRGEGELYLSAGVPIYFRTMYSGFYLEPGVAYMKTISPDIYGPQMLAGYHWMFDSGLNVSLSGGLIRNLNASERESTDFDGKGFNGCDEGCSDWTIVPTGYFRVGYSF